MSMTNALSPLRLMRSDASIPGLVVLGLTILGAGLFFWPGTAALLEATTPAVKAAARCVMVRTVAG